MTVEFVPAGSAAELAAIAQLAREIWYEYYVPLIGKAQVDYMVERFQSPSALQQQVAEGYEYFMMRQDGAAGGALGYIAVQAQPAQRQLFISKLYLHRNTRGRGTGRVAMEFIEQLALSRDIALLWLTVNKGNQAVQFYEQLGFHNAGAIVTDIGNGFVMDDFRMEKRLG